MERVKDIDHGFEEGAGIGGKAMAYYNRQGETIYSLKVYRHRCVVDGKNIAVAA